MKIKNLVSILIILSLVFCLVGCSTDPIDDPVNPTVSPSLTPEIVVSDTPNDEIEKFDVICGEKDVWEKEKQEITLNTIVLDSNWAKSIMVGDSIISAVDLTDISVVPNYYYGDNDSCSDLQTIYHVPTLSLSTKTNKTEINKFATVELDIVSTSYGPKTNANCAYDAIIEEVRFVSTINPYEGGLETLKNNGQSLKDGCVGIGSAYNNVIQCLGEPTDSFTDPMDDINITTCVYNTNNTELILAFLWFEKDGVESAVLTSIDWLPITVREQLHSQDNIEEFERYKEIVLGQTEFDAVPEDSDDANDESDRQTNDNTPQDVETAPQDQETE